MGSPRIPRDPVDPPRDSGERGPGCTKDRHPRPPPGAQATRSTVGWDRSTHTKGFFPLLLPSRPTDQREMAFEPTEPGSPWPPGRDTTDPRGFSIQRGFSVGCASGPDPRRPIDQGSQRTQEVQSYTDSVRTESRGRVARVRHTNAQARTQSKR